MADAELLNSLYVTNEGGAQYSWIVSLDPGAMKVADLPPEYGQVFVEHDWDTAFFDGNNHADDRSVTNTLILSKQCYEITPSSVLRSLSEQARTKLDDTMRQRAFGETNSEGISSTPVFLARMRREGVRFLLSPSGTNGWDFMDMSDVNQDAWKPEGSFWVPDENGMVTSEEVTAMRGLYDALSDASDELVRTELPA